MSLEHQKKINRLLRNTARAYEKLNNGFLKVPIEMALFALKKDLVPKVRTYLAGQLEYSGKCRVRDKPHNMIAAYVNQNSRTIYRHFKWLLDRDWMGKDVQNGWYFFRGTSFVHEKEGWKYSRSAVMTKHDIPNTKAFFIGAIIASIIKTGQATGTERVSRRSEQSGWPVSLSHLQKVIGCNRKTAFTYRKIAKKKGFIKMTPNLQQVELQPKDIHLINQNSEKVEVPLFGSTSSIEVKPEQLRTKKGLVYAQCANLIKPNIQLRKLK